jgi:hypothetical protein
VGQNGVDRSMRVAVADCKDCFTRGQLGSSDAVAAGPRYDMQSDRLSAFTAYYNRINALW